MACVFCEIREGRLPSTPVAENDRALAIMVQANGPAAFQSIPHFHIHLIPRWSGDGKGFDWTLIPADRSRLTATAERIRAAP